MCSWNPLGRRETAHTNSLILYARPNRIVSEHQWVRKTLLIIIIDHETRPVHIQQFYSSALECVGHVASPQSLSYNK